MKMEEEHKNEENEPKEHEHNEEISEHEHKEHPKKESKEDKKFFRLSVMLIAFAFIVVINNFALMAFSPGLSITGFAFAGGAGGSTIIGPVINEDGRTVHLIEWPTISSSASFAPTGDPTADAIAAVVPKGVPFYAPEGISFDDPLTAQKLWKQMGKSVQLSADQQQRWQKLVGLFTCDFCCGGPSGVTIISRCGCAHSYAWQGMAKFFVASYPDYTDEQILGEMTKWKAVWYPKGMVEYYMVYNGQMPASGLRYGGSDGIRAQFS